MPRAQARSARSSASQRLALRPEASGILERQMRNQPPPYQAPNHPLSEESQRKLQQLAQKYQRRKLEVKHNEAIKLLGECAHDLGSSLRDFEERVDRERKKAERDPERANVEQWEEKLATYRPKHDNLATRLEKNARTCVDLTKRSDVLVASVERSAEAAPLGSTPRGRADQRNGTQAGSSFEPTLPGATGNAPEVDEEGDTEMADVESTLNKFKTRRQQAMGAWTAKTLHDRYGDNQGYVNFRESLHEGLHGDEEDVPPSTRWFQNEEPAPGTTTQGAADESDDDIQVARTKISTKCPLTLQEFKDPVMSTVCKHTFEQSAILEMIGRRPEVQCPVGGCPNYLKRSQLLPNDKLLRKIRRIQQSRNRHREQLDDEDLPRGTNPDTSIMLSDGVDEDGGFQSVEATMRRVKQEKMSQPRRQAGAEDEVTDEDTEDE